MTSLVGPRGSSVNRAATVGGIRRAPLHQIAHVENDHGWSARQGMARQRAELLVRVTALAASGHHSPELQLTAAEVSRQLADAMALYGLRRGAQTARIIETALRSGPLSPSQWHEVGRRADELRRALTH